MSMVGGHFPKNNPKKNFSNNLEIGDVGQPNTYSSYLNFRNANTSMDPYWAGALAHTVMAVMSLAGLLINRKFKKRPVYLTCCAILCFGTSTLATYFYLNKNEYLKLNYPWTGWLPIISVILIYTSKALGIGSITHMLQVLSTLSSLL